MNKKLLTVAIGTALAAAPMMAAQADAKFYGHAQVEVSSQDSEFNTRDASGSIANPGFDGISVEDRARGRFGFKAKEDLGNGMKGLVTFEWRVDTTDNAADAANDNTTKDREMSVGIQASWGTVLLGNLKTPYKYTGGVKYDAFVATSLEARGNGGMTGTDIQRLSVGAVPNSWGHNSFMANAIGYKNKFGNFTAWVNYSPDENGTAKGGDGDISASLLYSAGNWEAFVALNQKTEDEASGATPAANATVSYDSVKFGGKFKFGGNQTIFAQLESGTLNDEVGSADIDVDTLFVGWQWKRGKNTYVAQYGMQTFEATGGVQINSGSVGTPITCTGTGDIDTDYIALGVIHKFTKKTRVWAGYRQTAYDGCTTNIGTGTTDPDDTALSVGIRKDF